MKRSVTNFILKKIKGGVDRPFNKILSARVATAAFFLFGGSDIVMLFQNKKVVIDADVGRKYLQGQRIGEIR